MTTASVAKRTAYLAVGGAGLLLSIGYLALSLQLPFGQMDQPGAAVFPLVVAAIFALASLATLHEGWQMDRGVRIELPAGADRKRVLGLAGLLLGYLVLLPWLGQIASSSLFFILALRLLSTYTWPRVVAYALVMSIALYGLFIHLLKVPMPKGMLGV